MDRITIPKGTNKMTDRNILRDFQVDRLGIRELFKTTDGWTNPVWEPTGSVVIDEGFEPGEGWV